MPKSNSKTKSVRPSKPSSVWKGPEEDGITFSLLSKFLTCRERFRIRVIEGLKPAERFSGKMEFGNLWHAAEEAHATADESWSEAVSVYASLLSNKFPYDRDEIDKWRAVVLTQFQLYVDYWSKHPDVIARTPLMSEQVFDVPYKLPSGRTVRLRGKWDSIDLVGGKQPGIWIQENKTKQRIDERQICRQLTGDLQTMLYVVAFSEYQYPSDPKAELTGPEELNDYPLKGVRYNIIRRTEHRVGKKETLSDFCDRLKGIVLENPGEWFMRWNVIVTPTDVKRFRERTLDPILEQLCEWYDCMKFSAGKPFGGQYNCVDNHGIHWQHPFGAANGVDEGWGSDLDEYLYSGDTLGLTKTDNLFPELT